MLRSKSILDASNVTLGQNSVPLLPTEILQKSRIIFQKAENICVITTSFIEIISPPKKTNDNNNEKNNNNDNNNDDNKNDKNDNSNSTISEESKIEIIYLKKIKIILNFLLESFCSTIECVSKILYVLPCPYIVSVTDWARTVSCFLHFRSASTYVLTVCHSYNYMVKGSIVGQNSVKNSVKDSMKKSVKMCLLSVVNLEIALMDMENIIQEEVSN